MLQTENNYKHTRLAELSTKHISEIDVEYDLRNFIVLNVAEEETGKVVELLFDVQSNKIRYLVIELQGENEQRNGRKILAPIGTVELAEKDNHIYIPSLNDHLIDVLPDYEPGQVNPGVENMVRLAYAGEDLLAEGGGLTGHPIQNDDDFYNHLHFDLNKLFGKKKKPVEYLQTLCGVFDDSLEAENTINDLIKEGFSQDVIELSSSRQADSDAGIDENINGGGQIICVKIQNSDEAIRATEIMNINGSVSVYETNEKPPVSN